MSVLLKSLHTKNNNIRYTHNTLKENSFYLEGLSYTKMWLFHLAFFKSLLDYTTQVVVAVLYIASH